MMAFCGDALVLKWLKEHEKELKEQYEKQFNDWKPFDDKYKTYFKDVWFGDYRQIRVLEAIIFVR